MSGIAKILKEMKANPKGVRFNDLQFALIISENHVRVVVAIVYIKLPGLVIHV